MRSNVSRLVLPLALAVVFSAAGCKADSSLRSQLLKEATETESVTWPRKSHVSSPKSGTFGEAAEPVVAKIVEGVGFLPSAEQLIAQPPPATIPTPSPCDGFAIAYEASALGEPCRKSIAERMKLLAPLLEATRTAEAGQPQSLRTTDPARTLPRMRALFGAMRDLDIAARVALVDQGGPAALATCADRLALVRDVYWGALLLDVTLGETSEAQALATCAIAAGRSPPAARRDLAAAADAVRVAMPPFVNVARREHVLMQVRAWGNELTDAERGLLPFTLKGAVGTRELPRSDWAPFRAHWAKLEAALRAPAPEDRSSRTKEVDAGADKVGAGPWARYVADYDRHQQALEVFVWALRSSADESEGKPASPLRKPFEAIAEITRAAGMVEARVAVEDEPRREIVMRVEASPAAAPAAPPPASPTSPPR